MPDYARRFVLAVELGVTIFVLGLAQVSSADLLIITREDTQISSVTPTEISDLWLKKSDRINSVRLTMMDIKEKTPERDAFYLDVVGMTDRQLKAYWAIQVFRGNGFPPEHLADKEAILEWLSSDKDRIGYILGDSVAPPLKIVYRREY